MQTPLPKKSIPPSVLPMADNLSYAFTANPGKIELLRRNKSIAADVVAPTDFFKTAYPTFKGQVDRVNAESAKHILVGIGNQKTVMVHLQNQRFLDVAQQGLPYPLPGVDKSPRRIEQAFLRLQGAPGE